MAGRHSLSERGNPLKDALHGDAHAQKSQPVDPTQESGEATAWLPGWERLDSEAATSAIAEAVGLGSTKHASSTTIQNDIPEGLWEGEIAQRSSAARNKAKHARNNPSVLSRVVGVIGELLITAGFVIGLFIVWQVWWTDIEANRAQHSKVEQLKEGWQKPPSNSGTVKIGKARTDPPPAVPHTTTVGTAEGLMRIPRFGKDYAHTIEYGTSLKRVLDKGAFGHYEGTAFPGEVGNFATAAHRQTYGAPMRDVDELEAGDPIILETKDAYLVYYMTESSIVSPGQVDVIAPDPKNPSKPQQKATERYLTITTCHPPFVSNERWIVHAKFSHWVDRKDGIPQELAQSQQ